MRSAWLYWAWWLPAPTFLPGGGGAPERPAFLTAIVGLDNDYLRYECSDEWAAAATPPEGWWESYAVYSYLTREHLSIMAFGSLVCVVIPRDPPSAQPVTAAPARSEASPSDSMKPTFCYWAWWLPEPAFLLGGEAPEHPPYLFRTLDADGTLAFRLVKAVGMAGYAQSSMVFFRIAGGRFMAGVEGYLYTAEP